MRLDEVFNNTHFVDKDQVGKNSPIEVPSQLDRQVFLMNFPLNMSTRNPNNPWMKTATKEGYGKINYEKAFEQFFNLYSFMIQQGAVVYLLPNGGNFQDQEYVANLGIYLPHVPDHKTVILSKYTSPPRRGEELVGRDFFKLAKYNAHMCPHRWEGEAELKFMRDNIYIGGHGSRSQLSAYKWMESQFDMKIIPVEMTNKKLYHFDTMFLRITKNKVLMPVKDLENADIKQLEKYVDIIDQPQDVALSGCFNAVMCGQYFLYADPRYCINAPSPKTIKEIDKFWDYVGRKSNLIPRPFNLHEFEKSGADLGCLIFHVNYVGF